MPDSPPFPAGLLAGSPVLTLRGEVPAETLPIGETLVGISGAGMPYAPLRLRRMTRHDLLARPAARPIRIRADAIELGMPLADVLVAPGQTLFLDGALVPAWRLEDGAGITREDGLGQAVFVRLALDAQDAVLVSGLAVATDADIRDQGSPQEPCAPAMDHMGLGLLRARIRLRAEEMGWMEPEPPAPAAPEVGTSRQRWMASVARVTPVAPGLPGRFADAGEGMLSVAPPKD